MTPHKVWQLSSGSFTDEKDAMEVARSVLLGRSLQFQSCDARTEGNCRIKPGNRLTVKHLGKQSDGEYLVYSVEHDFSVQDGYFTTCHLKRNFCGVGNRSGSISVIDRERIDRQGANVQEENAAATSASGNHEETHNNSENAFIENNSQASSEESSQIDRKNPTETENNREEILYDFGKIEASYRNWKQQDDEWKNEKLSNAAGDTMEKHGCKVVSAAKLVCTISQNNKFTPNRFTNKKDKIVDGNGDLSQSAIMSSIKKANPDIVVKFDYFEKQLEKIHQL